MKIFLGVLGVLALVGVAFACLSIYAKKEINKPKFEMPEAPEVSAVSPLPASKQEAYDYVNALFTASLNADDVELSEHTSISLTGDGRETPFSDADNGLFARALEQAQGKISGMFTAVENEPVARIKDLPTLGFTAAQVTDFTAEKGVTDENGETNDDGFYYISFTVEPTAVDTAAMLDSEVKAGVLKELEPMLSVSSAQIIPESFTAKFKIRYADDSLERIELKQNVTVNATVDFKDDYKAVSGETSSLKLPLEKTLSIDFFRYGLRFVERQTALQTGRTLALPLEVRVNSETTKDDYTITYTVSQDGVLDIDADGVMEVVGASEQPVTVTAVLEYDGHTYSDSMTVYATDLEVKTDER